MIRLIRWLLGWVEFSVSGDCGRFFDRARSGVWRVKKQGGAVTARCLVRSYRTYARAASDVRCRLRVQKRSGLPFFLHRQRRRTGLLVGFILCLFILLGSNLFVWDVEVSGNLMIPTDDLLQAAEQDGLHVGSLIGSVDTSQIEYELSRQFAQIAWVSVNRMGCTYQIEVSETTEKPEQLDESSPCNVAAAYDGLILSIEPYSGFSLVQAGDVVKKDDLLVSGIKENEETGQVLYAHANAKVVAEVERRQDFVRPLHDTVTKKTGEQKQTKTLLAFGLQIPLGFGGAPEGLYEESSVTEPVQCFGITLPFDIKTTTYTMLEQESIDNQPQELRRLLADDERIWEEQELLGGTIESRTFTYEQTEDSYILHASCVVRQRIDEQRPILVEDS